jgi:hypothetical protein
MKTKKIIGLIFSVMIIGLIGWKLANNSKYYSEIKFGNELIKNIEQYKSENDRLPNTDDWKLLDNLGFEKTDLGTNPTYEKIDLKTYRITFIKGFDGPYLTYENNNKKWLMK